MTTRPRRKKVVIPEKYINLWKREATLFTSVSLLDFLSREFEKGEVEPDVYHKQLKTNVKKSIKTRMELEEHGFQFEKWIEIKRIEEQFPLGLAKLRRVEGGTKSGTEDIEKSTLIDYSAMKKLPQKAADFVASSIELTDYLRLGEIATIGRIFPIVEQLYHIALEVEGIITFDNQKKDIQKWIDKLSKHKDNPGMLLNDKMIEQLEMSSVRWLNAFRREITNV